VGEGAKDINIFLIKIFGFYFFWLLADNWLHADFVLFHRIWEFIYHIFLKALHSSSTFVLAVLGYETVSGYNTIAIVGSYGLLIDNPCVGFGLTYGFASLIISYPGPWKKKFWFIPLGTLVILAVNVIRIVLLTIMITKKSITDLWMEQHDMFNNVIYFVIFLLWLWWVNFILPKKDSRTDLQNAA